MAHLPTCTEADDGRRERRAGTIQVNSYPLRFDKVALGTQLRRPTEAGIVVFVACIQSQKISPTNEWLCLTTLPATHTHSHPVFTEQFTRKPFQLLFPALIDQRDILKHTDLNEKCRFIASNISMMFLIVILDTSLDRPFWCGRLN